jgi:hypothetical protein
MKTGTKSSDMASVVVLCGVLLLACIPAAGQPTEEQALKDWNDLKDSYEALEQTLKEVVPSYVPNILGSDDEATLATLEKFSTGLRRELEKKLKMFSAQYGDTPEKIDALYKELAEFDWQGDTHPDQMPGTYYKDIQEWMANVPVACSQRAERLVQEASQLQERMSGYANLLTEENVEKLKGLLQTAVRYDEDNAEARELLDTVDKKFSAERAAIEQEIDDAAWPGNYKNFAGPGDPGKLAAAAMEYLQNDEAGRQQDDSDHTFAVCVKGDWVAAEKNILGQPIQWGLPIYGACYNSEEKARNVCRVFGLTILTEAGGPGQKKEPPFTGVWVGNIYKMRIANVAGGGAGGGGGAAGISRVPLRLGLILANIVAGLLAAAPLIKKIIPKLSGVYAQLAPVTPVLGFIVLIVGLVGLLANIVMRFAPLADLLPQLAAIVTGFVLGKDLVLQLMSGTKAQAAVETGVAKASALLALQVPLGLACLAMAVLHLVMGGVVLF